jgi:transcriptional regulator with XRE-family HTH domain
MKDLSQILTAKTKVDLERALPIEEAKRVLAAINLDLENDPKFMADVSKSQVINDLLGALEESKMSQSALARVLKKSRQYVSQLLNEKVNLTIGTLSHLSCALGRRLVVRIIRSSEAMAVVPIESLDRVKAATRAIQMSDTIINVETQQSLDVPQARILRIPHFAHADADRTPGDLWSDVAPMPSLLTYRDANEAQILRLKN